MAPAEAARLWIQINLLNDNGRAAITNKNDIDCIRYMETNVGITIILKDGTAIPVPYRYGGEPIKLH